jgi:hypothetical protein
MSHSKLGATVSGDAMMAGVAAAKLSHQKQRRWPKDVAGATTGLRVVTTIIIVLGKYYVHRIPCFVRRWLSQSWVDC